MHGIIFSFDKDLSKSGDLLDEEVKNRGLNNLEDIKTYLEVEFEIVKDIVEEKFQNFFIYALPQAITKLKKTEKVIIISTSKVETTKLILKYLGLDSNLIQKFDIYNSAKFGEKNDILTWEEIFANYNSIDEIYEDKANYLNAALEASKKLNFISKGFSKI